MDFEYVEDLDCGHNPQIEHYSFPYDRNYGICFVCKKYTKVHYSRIHDRLLNSLNGMANLGPAIIGISGFLISFYLLIFHHGA